MINDLKPYPAYKDSGVSWLGDLPETWAIRRIKGLARLRSGNAITALDIEESGPYAVYGGNGIRGFISAYTHEGDFVLIGRQGALCGNINYAYGKFWASEHAVVAFPTQAYELFWFGELLRFMNLNQYSISAAQPGLAVERIQNLRIPVPPLSEQSAIAHYLHHADRRIRRYITAKRKLIALLNERKQAIIHRAVTRGLDPNVRLKPSGVEWLGDVPEHWEVRRVKSLSLVQRGASPRPIADPKYFDESGEFAWVRIADVTASNRYLEKTTQRLSALGASLSVGLEPGALFLSIAGSVGKPIITRIKCCIHDGFVYFPQYRGNTEFLYRVFSCGVIFGRLGKLGTQLNLNTDTVGGIRIGWPPADEQDAIVSHLDDATAGVEAAIESAQCEIALLREFRTRLIADVVTGKLDVRDAGAQLPDDVEEPEPFGEIEVLAEGDEIIDQNDFEPEVEEATA